MKSAAANIDVDSVDSPVELCNLSTSTTFLFFIGPSSPPSRTSTSSFAMWGTAFLVEWLSPGSYCIFSVVNVDCGKNAAVDVHREKNAVFLVYIYILLCLIRRR